MIEHAQTVDHLLDSLGVDDPVLRQYLGRQFAQKTHVQSIPDRPSANGMQQRLKQSERLNNVLLRKLEILACALGACPTCWGEDPDCEDCGGLGKCGAFLPDRHCFDAYVRPVLKHFQRPGVPHSDQPGTSETQSPGTVNGDKTSEKETHQHE
jgi:hypothetical protein